MMSGVLLAAIGGALGGALGAILGLAVGRLAPEGWRRGVQIACVVALAALGGKLTPMVAGPQGRLAGAADVQSALLSDAQFGELATVWRDSDPQSFNAFVARLSQAGAGGDRASLIEQGRADLQAAAVPRLRNLDDAHLVEMLEMSRDQMLELRAAHPISCHPLFHNRGFGDITPYLSAPTRQRELDLAIAAFRADPNVARTSLEGEALTNAIDDVVARTSTDFGPDIALLAPDANVEGRETRACEAVAALYDHMLKLPPAQAGALMRGLLALR